MALDHDNLNPPGNDPLRTPRMTADEAKSVIALWQQERVEQTGLTDRPAVSDVAEGLEISVEEVQRLLAAIRARPPVANKRHLPEMWPLRVGLRREQTGRQRGITARPWWVEVKPGVWEDLNQPKPRALVSSGIKAGAVLLCLILSAALSVLACLGWIVGSGGPS